MSIQTELSRIINAKAAIKAAIEGKGVTVPDGTLLDGMASLIESIEAGGGGGVEVKTGSFILSGSDFYIYDTDGYSITHGLSGSPDLFVLIKDDEIFNAGVLSFYIYYKNKRSGNAIYGGMRSSGYCLIAYITPTVTTETVTIISNNEKLTTIMNNRNYIWIAMRMVT